MAIPQNSRKDALIILRNTMLLNRTDAEIELKLAEKERFKVADLNPELSKHIEQVKTKIAILTRNMKITDEEINLENKNIN